jgi:hypothetical protein
VRETIAIAPQTPAKGLEAPPAPPPPWTIEGIDGRDGWQLAAGIYAGGWNTCTAQVLSLQSDIRAAQVEAAAVNAGRE